MNSTNVSLSSLSPQERVAYATHLALLTRFREETQSIQNRLSGRNEKREAWDNRETQAPLSLDDLT